MAKAASWSLQKKSNCCTSDGDEDPHHLVVSKSPEEPEVPVRVCAPNSPSEQVFSTAGKDVSLGHVLLKPESKHAGFFW